MRRFKGFKPPKPDWQTYNNGVSKYRADSNKAREAGGETPEQTKKLNQRSRQLDAIYHYLTTGVILDEWAVEDPDESVQEPTEVPAESVQLTLIEEAA